MLAHQAGDRRSGAVKRYLVDLDARRVCKRIAGDLPDGTCAGVSDTKLSGILLGIIDKILNAVPAGISANGNRSRLRVASGNQVERVRIDICRITKRLDH